jgi:hypothetical protein
MGWLRIVIFEAKLPGQPALSAILTRSIKLTLAFTAMLKKGAGYRRMQGAPGRPAESSG